MLPEIDVELGMGTLGGRFTTIEGLLTQLKDEFNNTPFLRGDSADPSHKEHFKKVMDGIDKVFNTPPPPLFSAFLSPFNPVLSTTHFLRSDSADSSHKEHFTKVMDEKLTYFTQ